MGKYDNEANSAAKQTDVELKEAQADMLRPNLKALFPNPADKIVIDQLIAAVNKSTNRNEMINAVHVIGVKLSVEGAKILKDGFKIGKHLVGA